MSLRMDIDNVLNAYDEQMQSEQAYLKQMEIERKIAELEYQAIAYSVEVYMEDDLVSRITKLLRGRSISEHAYNQIRETLDICVEKKLIDGISDDKMYMKTEAIKELSKWKWDHNAETFIKNEEFIEESEMEL